MCKVQSRAIVNDFVHDRLEGCENSTVIILQADSQEKVDALAKKQESFGYAIHKELLQYNGFYIQAMIRSDA